MALNEVQLVLAQRNAVRRNDMRAVKAYTVSLVALRARKGTL